MPETKFAESLSKAIVPVILFSGLILFLYLLRRRNLSVSEYSINIPAPHEGLIVMLSDYRKISEQPGYESPDEIAAEIEAGTLDIERVFAGCNWGQSAFAVNFHAPALKELWVIITKDKSSPQFEKAQKLFKFIAGDLIRCDKVEIRDSSNIVEVARKISLIFRHLTDLRGEQIISDITGATSAMSGGMILATLDEGRKIEYVRQGITLKNFSAKEVREQNLIVSPETSPRLAQVFGKKN